MDLEFLLRRTPLWREIAAGRPVPGRRHRRARRAGRGVRGRGRGRPRRARGGSRLAGHRRAERSLVSHLLREHAPITEAGWSRLDDEARERLTPALAARRLIDFSGPHGWQHSATNLGRIERVTKPPGGGLDAAQRRVLPLVELRAPFTMSRSELADGDRGAEDVDLDAARRRRTPARRRREHGGLPRLEGRRRSRASPRPRRTTRWRSGRTASGYPRHVAKAVQALLRDRHRRPLRAGARTRDYTARAGDHRARRLPAARPPAKDPRRPARLGARRVRARSSSACAAATSCSSRARTSRSATTATTPTPCTSTWRRASASGSSRPRPPSPLTA